MQINMEVCRVIAVQHGLPLQFVIKEFQLFDVLSQIANHNRGNGKLVFKGGTALNKVYFGKLQRFSEDLDFDLDVEGVSEVLDFSKELAKKINGFEIKEFRKVKSTVQFYCKYELPEGYGDHVRIDISAKEIITKNPVAKRNVSSEYLQNVVNGIETYSIEDLLSRKLNALMERAEGKDLYDGFHGLKIAGKLKGAIKPMLKSEKKNLTEEEFIKKTIESVKKIDAKKARNLTNPFIPTNLRIRDWEELKGDVAIKLESALE